jgi:hypothetical protein
MNARTNCDAVVCMQDLVEELVVLRTTHRELNEKYLTLKFMYVELRLACRTGSQEEIQATVEKHTTQGDTHDVTDSRLGSPAGDGCPG